MSFLLTKSVRADRVNPGDMLFDNVHWSNPITDEGVPWMSDLRVVLGTREEGAENHSIFYIDTVDGEVLTKAHRFVSVVERHEVQRLSDKLALSLAAVRQAEEEA